MSFLHLVNAALLPDRHEVMPQVLQCLQQCLQHRRYTDAAQLLSQHTHLAHADTQDFIAHHVQGGKMSANLPSGPLLTAVHQAMQRGDTHHALYLLRAAQGKALGVKVAPPKSLPKELMDNMLTTLLIGFAICVVSGIALLMFIRSWHF
jgi:hypothetical protein